jgi:allophanate hydrolase
MPMPLTIAALHAEYAKCPDPFATLDRVYAAITAADDPGIFISLFAIEDAKAAAAKLPPFDPSKYPLWGIPFAVKDNIDVAGLPTTAACPAFAYAPARHAVAVQRLIDAGGIVIGKTNLDQFATGLVGVRTPYPVPRNAIDPTLVPGGSSSGSAVAVARGIVPFALGTDTAGSGRVPAALNNIVGLKPSLGAISTTGLVPACRSLDCISVFALTVEDAWTAARAMAAYDADDAFSRPVAFESQGLPPKLRVGVPDARSLEFFGDAIAAAAFQRSLAALADFDASCKSVDLAPFHDVARLLYSGPWVGERYVAIRPIIEANESVLHPVTLQIIAGARAFSAADAFAGSYALAALRRSTAAVWRDIDVMLVPSIPTVYTTDDLAADPIGPNSRFGTYTNFVNLLDLCALAVPGPFRSDGRAAGVTLIAPRGRDGLLATLGEKLHVAAGVTLGATGAALPPPAMSVAGAPAGWIEIACVGAHMSGLPLNHELVDLGGVFLRTAHTEAAYKLYALAGGAVPRPGLLRVSPDDGHAIELEVWALPAEGFARFVAGIPSPLGLATLNLADGTRPKGFAVEMAGLAQAIEISRYGGWRGYLAARVDQATGGMAMVPKSGTSVS